MNIHFWILVSDNWGIGRNIARAKVDCSRRLAWAFTRLSNIGYPQYLRNVDEVNCPRFIFVYFLTINIINFKNKLIMKKIKLLSVMMPVVMMLSMIAACGSDDNGTSQKVDDVNVINGKKIVALSFSEKASLNPDYKISYDNEGRLSKIFHIEEDTILYYKEIANIDYNMRVVTLPIRSYYQSFSFSLNDDGYISRIGKYILTYDQHGYLTTIDEGTSLGNIEYYEDDFLKASISELTGGVALYYVPYANTASKGELYIRINLSDDKPNTHHRKNMKDICVFIAYQAGLLGKVSKTVLNIKDADEGFVSYEYDKDMWHESGKFTYVCE